MSHTEEVFQACSEQGELTSPGISIQQVIDGVLHASSHVWMVRRTQASVEVMLQLRAQDKLTWPGHWDISAAGHVDYGETPLEAAMRETEEEIGVSLVGSSLRLLSARRDRLQFDDFIENEFRWVYLCEWQDTSTKLQQSEVEQLKWVSLSKFRTMTQSPSAHKLVDQGKGYFDSLMDYLVAYENNSSH